jgi:hypothetical protein
MEKGPLLVFDVTADHGTHIYADDDIFYGVLHYKIPVSSCISNSGVI